MILAGGPPSRSAPATPEHLLGVLADTIADYGIFLLDADGVVMTWPPGAARLNGWSEEEILGRHVSTLYPEDDVLAGKPDRDLAIAMADGKYEEEGWRIRKDGALFWASVVTTPLRGEGGRLLGFGKVTRDLSERKRADESLRQSEERFRLLVNSVADYAIFLLDPGGRIASWNLGAERLKGYRADEVIGLELATFYTAEDRRNRVPERGLDVARTTGRWADEGWRIRKDGSRFWASVVITRLVGTDGTERGFAKVTRDLTDRKRNEDALRGVLERERGAADQLRELDRLRSDLVSTVAHDLRGPVGMFEASLHLLVEDWATTSEDQRLAMIRRLQARSQTLAALVDEVFDLVRIDAGGLEIAAAPFDLRATLERAVDDAGLGTGVLPVGPPRPVWACGDDVRTWQILTNLLTNARKYSDAGTAVTTGLEVRGDTVEVSVTDEGPGIPAEELPRIFERFTRLPGAKGEPGSGLGLFIARSLAEAQGGRLEVDSTVGSGSTFRLVLPVAPS